MREGIECERREKEKRRSWIIFLKEGWRNLKLATACLLDRKNSCASGCRPSLRQSLFLNFLLDPQKMSVQCFVCLQLFTDRKPFASSLLCCSRPTLLWFSWVTRPTPNSWIFRTRELSFPGTFVPRNFRFCSQK